MRSFHGTLLVLLFVLLNLAVRTIDGVGVPAPPPEMTHEDSHPPSSSDTTDELSCAMVDRPSTKHVVVLVHGIMGTHKELGYVKEALEREFQRAFLSSSTSSSSDPFVVHAASSNDDQTLDGIEAGGRRLAMEINELLRNETTNEEEDLVVPVALSILGNSLGGLYARYALPHIEWNPSTVRPNVFITTATPHLGLRDMTLVPLPRSLQSAGASYLNASGRDLFQEEGSDVLHQLCLDPEFLSPLAKFSKRIAFANAFSTDAPVITATAAFLAESSSSLHILRKEEEDNGVGVGGDGLHVQAPYPAIRFETETTFREDVPWEHPDDGSKTSLKPDEEGTTENHHIELYSKRLDSLGWTKIFVDVRSHIPALWFRGTRRRDLEDMANEKKNETSHSYTSAELHRRLSSYDWNTLPFAHSFLVASAKNSMYQWFYRGGQPLVDRLAREMVHEILGAKNS